MILRQTQRLSQATFLLVCSVLFACSPGESTPYRLERVYGPFPQPTAIVASPTLANGLWVLQQSGVITEVGPQSADRIVLDISTKISAGGERGLLGIAISPEFTASRKVYLNFTVNEPKLKTVIAEYTCDASGVLDANSERRILVFDQPYSNHNGGQLAFGPDRMLYIGVGDGGSANDPHNNAQNKSTLLGKVLRIDVRNGPDGTPYSIPSDNPFVGDSTARGEIWAYGLRNPWRFSFDSQTGELYAADVGQNAQEEVDLIERGKNYGWKILEGENCLGSQVACADPDLQHPLVTYGRKDGISITGGYVYRGRRIAELQGRYVYGDFGSGKIWALRQEHGKRVSNELILESKKNISTFGVEKSGELLVADYGSGEIYRLTLQ